MIASPLTSFLLLALFQAEPTSAAEPQLQAAAERVGRPAAPYSLPPVSTRPRDGSSVRLVPEGTLAPVEFTVTPLDDSVPRPTPERVRSTPEGDVREAPASGDPYFLGFVAGDYFPPVGELIDSRLELNALSDYSDGRPQAETYAFVMFSARMTQERIAQLEAAGARVLGYHPHYTQKVALPASAISEVAALPFVRWIGVPQEWQKVHPVLKQRVQDASPNQPIEVWVNVFESDLGAASVRRTLPGTRSVDPLTGEVDEAPFELDNVWFTNGWQQAALENAGVEVVDFAARVNAFRARIMPSGLDLVTELDFVQFVEVDSDAELYHDESMAMVNADDSRRFFDGGTNQRTIAGIVDTGVESTHLDLNHVFGGGLNLSGQGTTAWDDPCGHGTHVAGTILGNGDVEAANTGVAPGLGWGVTGRLLNARVFASCASQSVDEAAVLAFMESAYTSGGDTTPRPHVINNSWGSGPQGSAWVGVEAECRLYDDNAYASAQLNVFSAGNDGPGTGTVGKQGVSKNVLTVGNVMDYDDAVAGEPGEAWTSSSRGPAGDGRWKPNVAAPGRQITSADAANTSGYVEKSGTSMAAPHVTGVAAALIDSDASFAYFPERIAAHLMATAHAKDNITLSSPSASHMNNYGTGRVDATRAIWGSGGLDTHWAFSLGSGGAMTADFTVPVGATRLVAVMHYVEIAASAGASQALVNDWDFYLDRPPIDPAGNTGEYFAQQNGLNNTEIRILNNPADGTWRWKVWPESTSSTAYFGVALYVQTADSTPLLNPSLVTSKTYVRPFNSVQVDYDVNTTGGSMSGVFVETISTASLTKASTRLVDGTDTDLLGNEHAGRKLMLGNVDPFFARSASWNAYWVSEGWQTFCTTTYSDNTSNDGTSDCVAIMVDGTQPAAVTSLTSTSHSAGVWSNDPTVNLSWTAANDPLSGGVASGIDGYSHLIAGGFTLPPAIKTLAAVTTYITPSLSNGTHYFNLRAVDRAGNWGSTASFGPLRIDTVAPGSVPGLASTTHTASVPNCSPAINISWAPASDSTSGIAGYGISFTSSPVSPAPTWVSTAATSTGTSLPAGSWYAHVRAIDLAGNPGPTAHAGPFEIMTAPPLVYCTAKINSQGCQPSIFTTGSPSVSGSLTVGANNVLNNKSGLLFWGSTASSSPFQGGIKCVANPVKRTPVQTAGGNPPPDDCSGNYSFNFSQSFLLQKGLTAGDTIFCQYWSRDPQSGSTTGLTDAVQVTFCE